MGRVDGVDRRAGQPRDGLVEEPVPDSRHGDRRGRRARADRRLRADARAVPAGARRVDRPVRGRRDLPAQFPRVCGGARGLHGGDHRDGRRLRAAARIRHRDRALPVRGGRHPVRRGVRDGVRARFAAGRRPHAARALSRPRGGRRCGRAAPRAERRRRAPAVRGRARADTAAEYAAAGDPPVRNAIGHLRAAVLGVLSAQAAGQALHEHAARAAAARRTRWSPMLRRCSTAWRRRAKRGLR